MEEAAGMPTLEELQTTVAADDADLEAKYQLAVRQVAAEEYEQALLVCLDILRTDREFVRT